MADGGGSFTIGQRVFVSNRGGVVRFCGETEFAGGTWVGIELDEAVGRNDGTVKDVSYFSCPSNHGIFVRPTQVATSLGTATPASPTGAKARSSASSSPFAVKDPSPKQRVSTASNASAMPKSPEHKAAEAKAVPKTAEPKAAEAKAEPKAVPKSPEPKAAEPTIVPKTAEPKSAEPKIVPKTAEPKAVPKTPEPKAAEPKPVPKTPETKAAEPKAIPKTPEPKAAEPKALAKTPEPKAAEPKTPKAAESKLEPKTIRPEPKAAEAKASADNADLGALSKVQAALSAATAVETFSPPLRTMEKALQAAQNAKDAEARAKKLATELQKEAADLQVELDRATKELEEVTAKSQGAQEAAVEAEQQLEKAMKAAEVAEQAALAAREKKAAELRQQAEEAAKNQDTLERERAAIQVQEESAASATEDADSIVIEDPSLSPASVKGSGSSSLKSLIERMQEQLALELKTKEFLDLEAEEITLQLEEVRETTQLAANEETWTEEVQVEWHKEALWSYYKGHRAEMLELQRRKAVLERAARAAAAQPESSHEDVALLRRAVEQLREQNEHLTTSLAQKSKFLEEKRQLQRTGLDMLETQRELEVSLSEEIMDLQAREDQLERVARELCHIRERQKQQRELQSAEVARLQSRLDMLRTSGTGQAASDPSAMELEILEVSVDCREAVCDAEMWMSCLPSQVREDAGLGHALGSICGLYRCYHKARILCRSIHQHCVAKAALVKDLPLMRYLCSANLAAAQLSYGVLAVLGCIQSLEASMFKELALLPAFASTAQVGETALDALIWSFLQICRGQDDSSSSQREALLAAVRAQHAQIMSMNKAWFNKQRHVDVDLRGACALEALRAACAGALYATSMAGGTHRSMWQELYESSDRLIGSCQEGTMDLFSISRKAVSKDTSSDEEEEDPEDQDDQEEEGEEQDRSGPKSKRKSDGQMGRVAECIDALLRHAVSLGNASAEKDSPQVRTFSLAEKELHTLAEAWGGKRELPLGAKVGQLPWEKLRQKVRQDLEVAEQAAQPAFEQVSKGLAKVDLSMSTIQERLARSKDEMHEVEKNFGKMRIQAERLQLLLSSVEQRRKQAQKGGDACSALEKEVKEQSQQCEEMDANYQESRQHCKELHHRLNELERRILRRYRGDVSAEEVIALRRTVARQLQEIQVVRARSEKGSSATSIFQALPRHRTESTESEGSTIAELWAELQKVRADLTNAMVSPSLVRLHEPEPEPRARGASSWQLQSVAKRVKALRERVTECAQQEVACGAAKHSVALSRFLKATSDAVKQGPMGKVKVPAQRGVVTLPLQMDEEGLRALHESLVPAI